MKYAWGVSQNFEFPTVYAKRAKLAKINDRFADASLNAARQEVLLDAKHTLLESIHTKRMLTEFRRREAFARNMLAIMQKKLDAGQTTVMDLNYAKLRVSEISQSVKNIEAQADIMAKRILVMNGNLPITISDSILILSLLPPKDSLLAEYAVNDPRRIALDYMVDVAQKNKQLVSHQGLPELSIGYESEKNDAEHFMGFRAGLSIPLWGNAGKSRAAKIKVNATQTEQQSQIELIKLEYDELYLNANSTKARLDELKQAHADFNNLTLLRRALEAGQVSIINFFNEITFLYDITDRIMALELEYAKYYAELHRFEL
jgi:outer membrane protein TolC